MWGAPSTGKTTFLAALAAALLDQEELGWLLRGTEQGSVDALGKMTSALVDSGEFPQATVGLAHYSWELVGPDLGATGQWRWFGRSGRRKTVRIPLELVDAAGRYADPETWESSSVARDLIANLARSAGIIFLYDPTREVELGDAFKHTYRVLTQLALQAGDDPSGRLPHYVAVCLTKFDEIRVVESAWAAGLVEQNPELFDCPYVPAEAAEEFFYRMCRVSRNPAAEKIMPALRQHFRKDRIKFFVTSAIGFYVDPGLGKFDQGNYQNLEKLSKQNTRVRGAIHPINIVEPVMWLSEKVAKGTGG